MSKKSKGRAELKRSGGGPLEGCVRGLSLEEKVKVTMERQLPARAGKGG